MGLAGPFQGAAPAHGGGPRGHSMAVGGMRRLGVSGVWRLEQLDRRRSARPVVVSEAARVSDADTRTALSAYDRDAGTLRFSRSTALLAALKLDDVLVSEPSAAAPSGFLRKVKSIRSEGSEVVLETTQASLTDVITQGDLSAETELGLDDLPDVKTLAPGITVHRAALGTIGAGDGYQFGLNFDQTILDIDEVSDDGDERVRAKIRIDGDIDFNAGYGIEIHIDAAEPEPARRRLRPASEPPALRGLDRLFPAGTAPRHR